MAAKHFSGSFKRRVLTVALGLCFFGGVQAQSTVGAVNGQAASGDSITVTNPATGFSRTITVGADRSYRFSQLPIGQYTVTRNGSSTRNITVNVGTAANVDFVTSGGTVTLDTLTVVGTGAINPIDVTSVESTTILTAEQIAKIPVGRDTTSVALLAPGTVRGDAAFGNLASFGGSSVAENAYFVNGFNITNSFRGLNFSNVPFEAIQEQQIKTGGYGAEFGRSLGGVVNQITKRGSNEFHAGGNIFWSPESLRKNVKDVFLSNPLTTDFGSLREDNSKDSAWNAVASVWGSGALVKDRLFAYGLLSFRRAEAETWGNTLATTNRSATTDTPSWLLKVDWNITDNHLLELTAFSDEQETETAVYLNTQVANPAGPGRINALDRTSLVGTDFVEQGGENYILKYTGYLTDNFTLTALYGRGEFSRGRHLLTADGRDVRYGGNLLVPASGCPQIVDSRPAPRRVQTGAYASICNITGGSIPAASSSDTRDQFRIDAEWQLGDHLLQFGIDIDNFESVAGESFEGGRSWVYTRTAATATVPFTPNTDIVTEQIITQGSTNKVKQTAFYIQDSWRVTDNFIAYLGGRWDTFENFDGFGNTFAKVSNQFGPRLGFSWDVNGDSRFKVFGNAGRYALPLMSTVAVRAASASLFTRQEFTFTGVDPTTGAPLGLTPVAGTFRYMNGENGAAKNPNTIATKNLDPMSQDEYILGFQKTLTDHFSLGVRGIFRDLKTAIDDNCDFVPVMQANGFTRVGNTTTWVDSSGRQAAHPSGGFPNCRLINPGADAVLLTDLYGNGQLTENTIPGALLSPKAKRTYSAMEFFFDGNWDKFFLQGSYTYAKSKGNTEGGVKSDIGAGNTSTTLDFDFKELAVDSYGYLPNDRRHSLKLFGNFDITEEWSVGVNYLLQSGRPTNCLGVFSPWEFTSSRIHPYGPAFFRCGTTTNGGSAPNPVARTPRGTMGRLPWTSNLDLNVAYRPSWAEGLQLKMDIFNVLNSQKVISQVEQAENGITGVPSALYRMPLSYQAPRSFRFMVQYDF